MNIIRQNLNRTEDEQWLAAFVATGDEAAFTSLVRKYENFVWNVCSRLLCNRCDAEDAFQATFMLLATRAKRIRKPKSLSSWLYGVAFRKASSIRRQRQRNNTIPFEQSFDSRLPVDVLELVARKNENELVNAELMLMSERHKAPLLMFYFLGCSTNEISNSLGLTVAAAESRLRQARRTLKRRLRLRGVEFETCFAGMALPLMVISPGLSSSTLQTISTASMTGWLTQSAYEVFKLIPQTGAKIMLCKIACSFGLLCLVSIGLIGHGGTLGQASLTQIEDGEGTPQVVTTFKLVDDQENKKTVSPFQAAHRHIFDVWKTIRNNVFGSTLHEQPTVIVEGVFIEDIGGAKLEFEQRVQFHLDTDRSPAVEKFTLVSEFKDEAQAWVVDVDEEVRLDLQWTPEVELKLEDDSTDNVFIGYKLEESEDQQSEDDK